ncbi:MAG: D-alanine--D-alanine ligase family protein [Chloroflexota bacterium]
MGNNQGRKLRVGVIFGGRSGEHEVSLASAQSVISALNPDKYEVIPVGITREGRWIAGDAMRALAEGDTTTQAATLLPEPERPALLQRDVAENNTDSQVVASRLSVITELDVIFPVMHGPYGEDGTVQGLLELANIPYVGAGVVGSAVGMDKAIFKHVMTANRLPVLPWHLVMRADWQRDPAAVLDAIESELPYPVFTKPANLGSSVGISKCTNREELEAGLNEAARFDRRIVVEQGIHKARELEVAVLGNAEPEASIVGEVRPQRDFYDYVAKYLAQPGSEDESELIIPARISDEMAGEVRQLAVQAYKAIDTAGLGRVDLLLDDATGKLFINEINTIPGFTTISMYPKLWEASGLPYAQLLDRLIELALERQAEKAELETTYDTSALKAGTGSQAS